MSEINFDAVIIGGGVVGTSIALELQNSGYQSVLIEKNPFLGEEVSSRNSGVIHAGMYYQENSLKARLTFEGNQLLYSYAKKHNVPFKQTGKIIYGLDTDKNELLSLLENGKKNGVEELSFLTNDKIRELEPNLNPEIAYGILSPHTGIVDVPAFIESLAGQFEENGGLVSKNSTFTGYKRMNDKHYSQIKTGVEAFEIQSKILIIAGGLNSYEIGKLISPLQSSKHLKKINLTKGHYFKISGLQPFSRLIYPLPGSHGLGIHYTLDIAGSVKFGPDVEFIDKIDYSFTKGTAKKFKNSIKKYWSAISDIELQEDYVGIRPKIQTKDSSPQDFSILTKEHHGLDQLVFMQGIESPGLTCSLSLARYIRKKLDS